MDPETFTTRRTGRLVQVKIPQSDWAFVPDPLPPKWEFPVRLWPLLVRARESLGRLDGIGRTLPNPELLLRPLEKREAIRSSSLEGTYASPRELLLFELQPREPKSDADPANAWREVSNYSLAIRHGIELLKKLPFCLRLIRELHKVLLGGVRGKNAAPGEFRKCQVHVGSDRRFVPPPPDSLPTCLDAFEKRLNREDAEYDPLVRCFLLHCQFEAIHPFIDGNGRVGRVLMSLLVYRWCRLSLPWLYLSAFFEKYKNEYIDNLYRISSEGDWDTWVEFCVRGTVSQAEDSIHRCDLLRLLKERFTREAGKTSVRAHAIIEDLFASPVVTVPSLTTRYSITYPTAKRDLEALAGKGILQEVPDTRPRVYFAPDIFEAAYAESRSAD